MNDVAKNMWDARYNAEGFLFGREPNAFLESQIALFKPDQKVLAIADGEGRNGVFVARQGGHVTSVDFSAPALEKARNLANEFNVEITIEQQDIFTWQGVEGGYDIVLAIFIQFATPQQRVVLFEQMKNMVKPGGLIVMQGYRPEQLGYNTGGPPDAENMYTSDLLQTAFTDFKIQHLVEHDCIIEEGAGHSGMSALIDMIAQRPEG